MTKEKFGQLEDALVDFAISTAKNKAPEDAVLTLPGVLQELRGLEECKDSYCKSIDKSIEETSKFGDRLLKPRAL